MNSGDGSQQPQPPALMDIDAADEGREDEAGLESLAHTAHASTAHSSPPLAPLSSNNDNNDGLQSLYQTLFEDAPQGCLVTDDCGVIQMVNHAAAALLETPPEEIGGTTLFSYIQIEALSTMQAALAQLNQGHSMVELELTLKPGSQGARHLAISGRAVPSSTQVLAAVQWSLHDITPLKQREYSLQQRLQQGQVISSVVQRIRQSLDPHEILTNTVDEVKQALQADRALIYGFDAMQGAVVVAEAVTADYSPLLGTHMIQAGVNYLQSRYRTREAIALHDIDQADCAASLLTMLRQQQVKAAIALPILREDQLLGLLAVHQCQAVRHWQPFEVDLLHQLAEQVSIALQQSQLYQQSQQLNADLEEQVRKRTEQMERVLTYESMLKRITDKVRDSLDEAQILQAAVQELTIVMGLAGCNAALYDLDQNTSTILYEYTHTLPAFFGKVARMEDSPDLYRQLQQGNYFQFCSLYPNPARGRVAMLACPIFVDSSSQYGIEQAILGDLWLINHKDHVFNESEIRLAQQVANQCAIAIRQARLYRAAQVQVQELERLNQLKDQFLSTVSHELRTPISNVKMAVYMLKTTTSEAKRQQYLGILESELAREAELINDLLDLQRLEENAFPLNLEPIHLSQWILDVLNPFRTRTQESKQTVRVQCPARLRPIVSDGTLLKRVLAELLNNACKYTPKGATIELTVTQDQRATPAITRFTLRNQADIPHGELPHIFEKFYRVLQVDRYKHGGTGLGLALVKRLVEQLDGTIEAQSMDGWTTFTVTLPITLQAKTAETDSETLE
ncbi:MAG: GAF domain-containing protein [Kaiparowitsia implicata GSE-PSE-MK54-09C]|nr:GAF domain-containing protein [Kaiparowitsia implicata GSE-PSE-MK54-09C]